MAGSECGILLDEKCVFAGSGCVSGVSPVAVTMTNRPNIVVWVPDDWGRDAWQLYGLGAYNSVGGTSKPVRTPNLDAFAQRGVRFTRAYSQPWCSPSRAAFMTGRWGHKTGIGSLCEGNDAPLLDNEVCLPAALKAVSEGGYACGAFGKWHLSNMTSNPNRDGHPITVGFDEFVGTMNNIELPESYYHFDGVYASKTPTGVTTSKKKIDRYAPLWHVDEALRWIDRQTQPWFLYMPMNLPHGPVHRPPADLYDTTYYDLPDEFPSLALANDPATCRLYFGAMVEAMDALFGRFLAGIPQETLANTYVIVWSDNGAAASTVAYPLTTPVDYSGKAKRTVYELGCNVPLAVSGPGVTTPGRTSSALVSPCDMFSTLMELTGYSASDPLIPVVPNAGTRNSVSFKTALTASASTVRNDLWIDLFAPNRAHLNATVVGSRALVKRVTYSSVTKDWKLVRLVSTGTGSWPSGTGNATDQFFDLTTDPLETTNLIAGTYTLTAEQANAYSVLTSSYATYTNTY